ncbi:MAG TPA: DUF5808 domain-containing protein [Ktedonobacterales bacterium]
MNAYGFLLSLILGLLIVAAILLFLPIWRSQDGGRAHDTAVRRGEERYWLGGVIYYNSDDPDLWVQKRYGRGWTLNFAHPGGKLFLAVMLALLLLPELLLLLGVQLTAVGCHPSGCFPVR